MKYLEKFKDISNITKLNGWVNIKIDDQLYIRMAKYVYALDTIIPSSRKSDKFNLFKKIELLSNIDKYIKDDYIDIQVKISIITLLQYLNELKEQFNPSSSGFLLEGFLACLIHGEKTKDFDIADITSAYDELDAPQFRSESGGRGISRPTYQIKLYKRKGSIKINWKKPCNFYVICLKNDDSTIDIHVLSNDPSDSESYIGRFLNVTNKNRKEFLDSLLDGSRDEVNLYINNLYSLNHKNMINLDIKSQTIERLIQSCGREVKKSIEKIYNSLSDLHYDIDSLVSGYNKNKEKITIEKARNNSLKTIENIKKDVSILGNKIRK